MMVRAFGCVKNGYQKVGLDIGRPDRTRKYLAYKHTNYRFCCGVEIPVWQKEHPIGVLFLKIDGVEKKVLRFV
jgi:hypothetical protein